MTNPRQAGSASQPDGGLWHAIAGRFWGHETGYGVRLASGTAATLAMKIVFSGLSFFATLLLARWLGSTGYGAYTYAAAWAAVISGPAAAGLDSIVMRETAACGVRSAWGEMRGLLRKAGEVVALLSCALAAAGILAALLFAGRLERTVLPTLIAALLLVPLLAMTRVGQAALQGLHHVGEAQFPAFVVQPVALIASLTAVYLSAADRFSAPLAMAINVGAVGLALIVLWFLLRRRLKIHGGEPAVPYRISWAGSVLPLVLFGALNMLYNQTDVLFVGTLNGPRMAGIYGAASRSAGLIGFFLMAVTPALAPAVSSLYEARDLRQLERVVIRSARLTLAAALVVAIFFFLLGHWYLVTFFGRDFGGGNTALRILCVGQLVNVAMGSVAYLLVMTRFEREAAAGAAAGALANGALNAALTPWLGMTGAALAFTGSMIFTNVWYTVVVYRKVGIHSTALGRFAW